MRADRNRRASDGVFTVRSVTVSVVLLCVAVSSLASLVVVATITRADALSTVALALAVLAFAAQLIVSLAQSQSATAQTRDTGRTNAETRAVLSEIRAQVGALVTLQSRQFDKVLDRAINSETVEAALSKSTDADDVDDESDSPGVDPEVFAAELRALAERSIADADLPGSDFPATLLFGQHQSREIVDRFCKLDSESAKVLMRLIERAPSKMIRMDEDSPRKKAVEVLLRNGFVRLSHGENREGERRINLTPDARLIGELLDPSNPARWAPTLRKIIRGRLAADDIFESTPRKTNGSDPAEVSP